MLSSRKLLCHIIIVLSLLTSFKEARAVSFIEDGELRLSTVDLRDGVVHMQGDMFFCEGQFITAEAMQADTCGWQMISTLNSWNKQPEDYESIDELGFGTYYFKVKLSPSLVGKRFIIRPEHFISYASQLFVNGTEYSHNGAVGCGLTDSLYVPSRETEALSFVVETSELDIVIWVSNFHHFRGGIFRPISMGLEEEMMFHREQAITFDLLVIVSLLIMFLYHLILFGVNRSEKTSLYFAFVCLVFSVDLSLQGPMCFFLVFPNMSFDYYSKIHLITPYLVPASFMLFMGSLFPRFISSLIIKLSIVLALLFSFITLWGGITLRSLIVEPHYVYALLLIIYVILSIARMLNRKVYGAQLFAAAFAIFALCAVNDILNMFEVLHTHNVLSYGIVVFVFLLSVLYGRKTHHLHEQLSDLSEELKDLNAELEHKVEERTNKLNTSLAHLGELNRFQAGMTQLIASDLKKPLMAIVNTDRLRKQDFPRLRNTGYRMLNMIQNMLDLYRFNQDRVTLSKTRFRVEKAVDGVIQDFVFLAKKKSIKVEFIQDEIYALNADLVLFKRVMTNVLSTLLRLSSVNGLLTIRVSMDNGELLLSMCNENLVLTDERRASFFCNEGIFDLNKTERQRTTELGLLLSKMVVEAHDGSIGIVPCNDMGTDIWVLFPKAEKLEDHAVSRVVDIKAGVDLSPEEKVYLRPFAEQLKVLEVFEATKIDMILSQVSNQDKNVKSWILRIEKVCYTLDEDRLRELINFVLK